jgi:hypothetical protein
VVSADLASKRAAAMYGLEAEGRPSGEVFGKEDAQDALAGAGSVLKAARRLIEGP